MKIRFILPLILLAVVVLGGCSKPQGITVAERRNYIQGMRQDTMKELYLKKPEAKEKIQNSAGYGVFSNLNVNLILAAAGDGYGVVLDKATGEETYMKMGSLGIGLGLGVKDFRAVIIFRDRATLTKFVTSGWEFGGHADAAAKAGEKGGAVSGAGDISSGMEIYQLTQNGIALQATITGTKYWKDVALNQ